MTVSVVVCNVHQSAHLEDSVQREEQSRVTLRWLEHSFAPNADAYVVLGDFNAPPNEPTHDVLREAGYTSVFAATHDGQEPASTFPTAIQAPTKDLDPAATLDYIYIKGCARPVASRLFGDRPAEHDETLYPSDHLGIVADLVITTPEPKAPSVCVEFTKAGESPQPGRRSRRRALSSA